ncbi:hypothetical protein ACRRTK_004355 [Alexandromys fortis]
MTECLKQMNGMPPLVQECTIPCREDCTFTPWSKFTPCSKNCEATQIRRRQLTGKSKKREKCQDAALYPLVEMEPCPCDAFMSHPYGNWSACILPESKRDPQRGGLWGQGADKECGEGVRFRAIACSDKNGRPVDPSFCNSSGKESREKSQMRTLTQLRRFVPGPEIAVDSFFKKGFYSYLPIAHCHYESKACKMHNTPSPSTVI